MARKLTKAELERCKTDFGPPTNSKKDQKPDYKTQYKEIVEKEKAAKKPRKATKKAIPKETPTPEKHAGGRPKKNDEETRVFSFRLSDRTVRRLRVLAALQGVSAADIIAELADRENVPGIDN